MSEHTDNTGIDTDLDYPERDDIETDPRFARIRDQIIAGLTDEQKDRIIAKFVENTIWLGLIDEWDHDDKDACLIEPVGDFAHGWDDVANTPLGLPHPGDAGNAYLQRWHQLDTLHP